MINYQYYHTGRGYEGKLNLDIRDEKYNYYNQAFDKNSSGSITKSSDSNAFIYVCNENEWMMYRNVETKEGIRGEGFAGGFASLAEMPYKYINKLSPTEHDGSDLPEKVSLPAVERDNANYQIPKNLVSTVIKIIDVLFNGNFMNRPQIKINADKETGIKILILYRSNYFSFN